MLDGLRRALAAKGVFDLSVDLQGKYRQYIAVRLHPPGGGVEGVFPSKRRRLGLAPICTDQSWCRACLCGKGKISAFNTARNAQTPIKSGVLCFEGQHFACNINHGQNECVSESGCHRGSCFDWLDSIIKEKGWCLDDFFPNNL